MTRLRIVPVPDPNHPYMVVLDRHDGFRPTEGVRLGDQLHGCAGVLVFAGEVVVE